MCRESLSREPALYLGILGGLLRIWSEDIYICSVRRLGSTYSDLQGLLIPIFRSYL